ncbi:MAG: hypothetical protein V3S56_02865 [Gemmatimonadota bacterium]
MSPFERWSVRITSLVVAVTGFALLWLKYGFESADPFAVINHPLQPLALKSHVLVAPLFVFAVGLIATRHVWRHVVVGVKPGRTTGLVTLVSLVPMAATGYAIQVVVSETWRTAAVVTHIAASVLFTLGIVAHLVLMWRYLRSLRDETFCTQARTVDTAGRDR